MNTSTTLLLIEDGALVVGFVCAVVAVTVAAQMLRAYVDRRRALASFYMLRRTLEDGRRDMRAFEDVCWARLRDVEYEAAIGLSVGRHAEKVVGLVGDILHNRRGGLRVVSSDTPSLVGVD